MFHHTVAKILLVSARYIWYIKAEVGFITKIVNNVDEDDWVKLKRLLKYLKGGEQMKFNLNVDYMSMIHWWLDSSYNTHACFRVHTRSMVSLVFGVIKSLSNKHKLNIIIPTKGKLVGTDDTMGSILLGE